MADILEDRFRTVAERYGSANGTSDLTLNLEGRCDADLLLAAGYASANNQRGMMALHLYRMKLTGDRHGVGPVTEEAMSWLVGRGVRAGGREKIGRPEARHICETVLKWWLDDVCRRCKGRRYELIPGTNHVSDRVCETCFGGARRPLEAMIEKRRHEPANWLASELDALVSYIVGDMAKILNGRMSVFLDPLPREDGS
jgi:hypothetical protein